MIQRRQVLASANVIFNEYTEIIYNITDGIIDKRLDAVLTVPLYLGMQRILVNPQFPANGVINKLQGELNMIDFANASFLKLKPVQAANFEGMISPLFIQGETIISAFQSIRDGIVFTNKRIFTINVQGITGKKKDFTSLPYSKIQAFSVETAGVFDLDSELELWFSGLGKVRFEFVSNADVAGICRTISSFVL